MTTSRIIRSCLAASLLSFLLASPGFSEDAQSGDTEADVLEKMGQPQGVVKAGGVHIWTYQKGEVEFSGTRVSRVSLMSSRELDAHKKGLRLQALNRKRAEEASARGHQQQAKKRKQELLSNPAFTNLPPAERVDLWEDYYRNYPDEEPAPQLEDAKIALEVEAKQLAEKEEGVEPPPPRLSGSKKRKARRGAGKVKPEDRPAYLTRQTLNVKAKEDDPSFLSSQTVKVKEKQDNPSFLGDQRTF